MKQLLLFIIVCFWLGDSIAQKDFGMWSGIDLRVPLTQKLDAGMEIEMRFHNNVSSVNTSFLSPYLKYEVQKYLGIGVNYRWSNEPIEQGVFGPNNFHRLTFDVEAKKLIELISNSSPFDASLRLRYTHETTMVDRSNDYWRTQFEIKYNWEEFNLKPEVSAELFYHFNDQFDYTFEEVRTNSRFNKYRIRLGMGYEINKRHEAKIFYMLQSQFESPKADYILGIGYSYRFKRIFSKKD